VQVAAPQAGIRTMLDRHQQRLAAQVQRPPLVL
jgi:hypothetical protein